MHTWFYIGFMIASAHGIISCNTLLWRKKVNLGKFKRLLGPRHTWQICILIYWCLANIRVSSCKCSLYSPGAKFPLYKQGYWKISTILSNSDIRWSCGLGHVQLLSNTISLAPEFKIILSCCETKRDIRGESDMITITFGGWSRRVRRKLVWSQRKAAWNLVSSILLAVSLWTDN